MSVTTSKKIIKRLSKKMIDSVNIKALSIKRHKPGNGLKESNETRIEKRMNAKRQ